MITKIIVIGRSKTACKKQRPQIRFAGAWLEEFGFREGTVLSAEFAHGEMILRARGRGIDTYKECISDIRKKGGLLTQVSHQVKYNQSTPHFVISGPYLTKHGFNIGDVIILSCSPEKIHVMRLEMPICGIAPKENQIITKVITVGSRKATNTGEERCPRIRIGGFWIEELGFVTGMVISAEFAQGKISFKAIGLDDVIDIRENRGLITKVINHRTSDNKEAPEFIISGSHLTKHGFNIGDIIALSCTFEEINVTRLEMPIFEPE